MTGQVVPIKLNAEKEGATTAKKYGVSGFPTILFLDDKGAVNGKIIGFRPPRPFSSELRKITQNYQELPALRARVSANPKDVAAIAKLGSAYAAAGDVSQAEAMLARGEAADPGNKTGNLASLYNAIADSYQEKQQFDKAVPLFTRAARTSKSPRDTAYAYLSIGACHASQRQFGDALSATRKALAVPGCPPDLKAEATQMQKQLEQAMQKRR